MLAMEGKIVLPMHLANFCEKEEVNIHQHWPTKIALVHTHVEIEYHMQYATYFSIPSVNTLVFADK
jgi:hypothetical protein